MTQRRFSELNGGLNDSQRDSATVTRGNSFEGGATTNLNSEIDELDQLRRLLLRSEQKQLIEVQSQLENLQQTLRDKQKQIDQTSEVLVSAINKKLALDDQLGDALRPVVVTQFNRSAREQPDDMADALYPILGPAIRKMIAGMLTPDPKARKRRYRVEQLFLIENQSGLPVCHAIGDSVKAHDADMVSGMLSAIQSFVHEAFSTNEFDGLDTLQVGDLAVWIEWGPDSVLAAVIRGVAPKKLRESMQLLLENIHSDYADELQAYEGDASAFEPLKDQLQDFLGNHDGTLKNAIKQLSDTAKYWIAGGLFTLVCILAWSFYQMYDSRRWNNYIERVSNEPGIVIVKADRRSGNYVLSGLRDPLARDPSALLAGTGIRRQSVVFDLKPFQSLHADVSLQRLKTLLRPPPSVRLYLAGTTLQVVGEVDQAWKSEADRIAGAVSAVDNIIYSTK